MLTSLISDLVEAMEYFVSMLMINALDLMFQPENSMDIGFAGVTLGVNQFNFIPLFTLFRDIGLALITLKFLKKGFDIYVGWIDGDKDNDVSHLILNYIRAIVTVFSFSFIYTILVDMVRLLMTDTLDALVSGALPTGLDDIVPGTLVVLMTGIAGPALKIFLVVALIILIILAIIYIRLMIMGIQMLALRIAFPIACVGLIDSDKGIFKPFMQKFFMLCVSAFAQIFFFRFSLLLLGNGNPLWALAVAMAAMRTPELLRDFMLGYGGAGVMGRGMGMVHSYFMIKGAMSKGSAILSRLPAR